MSRYGRGTVAGFSLGGGWTPGVKALVMTCGIAFVLQIFEQLTGSGAITREFGLTPAMVTQQFFLWQLVTYIFLHGNFMHILFNMFALYMFGSELEVVWGRRQFLKYFFICGIGAALATILVRPHDLIPTIGASGAIFGVLLAYGILFPDRPIYLYMIVPIPAKWFVIIIGAFTFYSSLSDLGIGPASGSNVAYLAHLGGLVVGFVYLRGGRIFKIRGMYDRWKRDRARRKFDVHYNERRQNEKDNRFRRW